MRPELTSSFAALRADGARAFSELGLPSTRLEPWRYFPTRPLRGVDLAEPGPVASAVPDLPLPPFALSGRVVIVNGQLRPELSDLGRLADRVSIGGLVSSRDVSTPLAQALIGAVAPTDRDALVAANAAYFSDGLCLDVPAGVVIEDPIEVLHVTTAGATGATHLRHVIRVGRSAEVRLVVHSLGLSDAAYVTNVVTEVQLGDNAVLQHVALQEEGEQGFHVSHLHARQAANSQLRSFSMALGGRSARTSVRTELAGAGAHADVDGLYVGHGAQRLDQYLELDHQAGHTSSSAYFAGILDDTSIGNFQGLVFIREGARKSVTNEQNRNLLLSDGAQVNTKPQLEIDNDDVKAAHGATVGQLDPAQIFYLTARGIDPDAARDMLTFAFARDALGRVTMPGVRDHLVARIAEKLGAGDGAVDAPDGDDAEDAR